MFKHPNDNWFIYVLYKPALHDPQAETERERRAKKINSLGELEAAENLAEAARTISAAPGAMQLRYLQVRVPFFRNLLGKGKYRESDQVFFL